MEYAFLTMLIPKQVQSEVERLSVKNMQDAANTLQWNIYNGLCNNLGLNVKLFNVLPIGSFPQYYKKIFVHRFVFSTDYGEGNINIGFCNVKFLKNFFQVSKIFSDLKKWCASSDDEKVLFVYTLSAPFLSAVMKLKKKYPKIKVCSIVADLPDMLNLSSHRSFIQKKFEQWLANRAYKNMTCIDYYVLLTKYMAEPLGIKKPYIVMEGIAEDKLVVERRGEKIQDLKTILYTGTLHEKFGALDLVQAFMRIPDKDYRLILCGIGDSEEKIIKAQKMDARIQFRGKVTHEEACKLQSEATVLVNPRKNNEAFTKYSFPSKTMEYLSSGTPVIAYKLDGIPEEYNGYINYVSDNSPEAMADKIRQICEMPESVRQEMGARARQFVLSQKNCIEQTKKILDLLKE